MSQHLIVRKIRKLLRLAQTEGPEGERALERAQHLMKRHNVQVELEEFVRVPVEGVAGEFWREQLLLAIAKSHHCAYTESTKAPRVAALYGEPSAIGAAIALYQRLLIDMAVQCQKAWKSTVAGSRPGFEEIMREVERMWRRVFHMSAAINLAQRIDAYKEEVRAAKKGVTKPAPRPQPEPQGDEAPPSHEERVAKEREISESQLEKLAKEIGTQAMQIQEIAWHAGRELSDQMDIGSTHLPALPVVSTLADVELVTKVLSHEERDPLQTARFDLLEID